VRTASRCSLFQPLETRSCQSCFAAHLAWTQCLFKDDGNQYEEAFCTVSRCKIMRSDDEAKDNHTDMQIKW